MASIGVSTSWDLGSKLFFFSRLVGPLHRINI
jgi:hypothetical protein